MSRRFIITESEKKRIRDLYGIIETTELKSFPISGGYNIGYDKNWNDFSNPKATANSDFSREPTGYGASGHPHGHIGVDIFADRGTPVVAPVDGKVKINLGNGNTVIIKDDATGYSHWLGHLDSITVDDGDYVTAGTQVGTVGDTGNAKGTAPHVHYNVYKTSSGFYSGEDPTEELIAAIDKTPSELGNYEIDLSPEQKDIVDGLKKLYQKITGKIISGQELLKSLSIGNQSSDILTKLVDLLKKAGIV